MENIQRIQDFLNNRISDEEKIRFEKEMKENPILFQDVLLHKYLQQALAYQNTFEVKEMLKEIAAETPLQPDFEGYKSLIKVKKWGGVWRLGLLSLVIVAIVAGSFWAYQNRVEAAKLQAIAAPHWSDVFDYAVRIDDADISNFAKGMRAYKSANYVEAASAFEKHLIQKSDDGLSKLYLGIAYALSQQQGKAIENLLPLANNQSDWSASAQWYLALCYLRDGNATEAQKRLETLRIDTIYGEKAQKAIELMK